jgi:hypothetical protein
MSGGGCQFWQKRSTGSCIRAVRNGIVQRNLSISKITIILTLSGMTEIIIEVLWIPFYVFYAKTWRKSSRVGGNQPI